MNDGAVQLLELGDKVETQKLVADQVSYIEEKRSLAKKLGLREQANMFEHDIELLKKPRLSVEPMTADEQAIWQAFLPKTYKTGHDLISIERRLTAIEQNRNRQSADKVDVTTESYKFDRIPHSVLAKWGECVDQQLFDTYEIWSPEVEVEEETGVQDPALIGYIGERCYMIARWAESDANLVDINVIKRKLIARFFTPKPQDIPGIIFIILLMSVATIIASLAWMGFSDLPNSLAHFLHRATWVLPIIIGFAVASTLIGYLKDPLMKAIRQHGKL